MGAGKMNAGTQKKKNTAHIPGFRFCRYEKSQLESMDKEQLVAIVLEQQEQLTEAGSILKEQEHVIRHITEQLNLRNADLYGPRSEKSRKLQDDRDKGGKDEPERFPIPTAPRLIYTLAPYRMLVNTVIIRMRNRL